MVGFWGDEFDGWFDGVVIGVGGVLVVVLCWGLVLCCS